MSILDKLKTLFEGKFGDIFANEIAEKLKVGKSTTIMSLRKMRDRGEIKFKKEGGMFYYKA